MNTLNATKFIALMLVALMLVSGCKRGKTEQTSVEITPVAQTDPTFIQSKADILREAAKTGDTGALDFLLKSGVPLELPEGGSVLLLTMKHRRDDAAVYLIEHNARLDVRDEQGGGPLHYAASFGLYNAAGRLIRRGAQLDLTDNTGMRPLAYAVYGKHLKLVDLLLASGAAPDGALRGKTLVDYARSVGAGDIAERIAAKQVQNGKTSREIAPEYLARAQQYADNFLATYDAQMLSKKCAFQARQFSTAADFVRRARELAETNYPAIPDLERYAVNSAAALPPCLP